MKIIARPYQVEARRCVIDEWKEVSSTLVVKPVGTGKTILFALIIEAMRPQRALVIAERKELIWQARDKIQRTTGLECGIEMGDLYVNNDSLFGAMPVIISTIQTQCSALGDRRRMSRFNPKDFGVLVIDECHHGTAKSYRDLINYYKTNNPDIRIVGVTATPDRADEEALGQVFETVAFDYEIQDAIHDGWLVPVEQQFVTIGGLDFSSIRTTAGDLNGADLAAIMESEKNMQGVASASIEIIGDKRTLAFTASVKQAETLSNIFNRHKPGSSEWVCGKTNTDQRRDMLDRFKDGKIQIMVNCNCLSEGFDDPGVEVVLQARPTKSRSLYAQQIGRAMRPLPGVVDGPETPELRKESIANSKKPACLVVDFVGNSGRHKLITTADILGGKVSDDAVARAIAKAKKAGGAVRMDELLDKSEEEIRNEIEERRRAEEARKARLVAKVKYSAKSVSPFDVFQITPVKERGWDQGRVLSEAQRGVLLKAGINPDTIPYAQGRQLVGEICARWNKKLATIKQLKVLSRFGYSDPNITFEQASKTIDALSQNGWRRPVEVKS